MNVSRLSRSGPPVSMFAFQDIIMSLTGIVIVMVLLLTLELVERPEAAPPDALPARLDELQQQIRERQQKVAALQASVGRTGELIRQAATATPADLQQQIASTRNDIDVLDREIRQAESQRAALTKQDAELDHARREAEQKGEEVTKLEVQAKQVDRTLKEEQAQNRLIIGLPRGFDKQGWVVVCSAGHVAVAPLGRPAVPVEFDVQRDSSLAGRTAASEFLKWADDRPLPDAYFLLMVRPGGIENYRAVLEGLTKRNAPVGIDLIAEDRIVLDPQRGAAP